MPQVRGTVGRWSLIEYRAGSQPRRRDGTPTGPRRRAQWRCICECGTEQWVHADNLTGKTPKSLGCRQCAKLGRPRKPFSPGLQRLAANDLHSTIAAWASKTVLPDPEDPTV
jgi:hypothetical protein